MSPKKHERISPRSEAETQKQVVGEQCVGFVLFVCIEWKPEQPRHFQLRI